MKKIWTKNPEIDIYQEVEDDDEDFELPEVNKDDEGTGVEGASIEGEDSEYQRVGEKLAKKKTETERRASDVRQLYAKQMEREEICKNEIQQLR